MVVTVLGATRDQDSVVLPGSHSTFDKGDAIVGGIVDRSQRVGFAVLHAENRSGNAEDSRSSRSNAHVSTQTAERRQVGSEYVQPGVDFALIVNLCAATVADDPVDLTGLRAASCKAD